MLGWLILIVVMRVPSNKKPKSKIVLRNIAVVMRDI